MTRHVDKEICTRRQHYILGNSNDSHSSFYKTGPAVKVLFYKLRPYFPSAFNGEQMYVFSENNLNKYSLQ